MLAINRSGWKNCIWMSASKNIKKANKSHDTPFLQGLAEDEQISFQSNEELFILF